VRHRLSLAGNRHLNYALHMVAVCQASSEMPGAEPTTARRSGRASPARKRLRCLKRRVGDAVFRSLMADSQALRTVPLDKEEPRENAVHAKFGELAFHAVSILEDGCGRRLGGAA
jgi:transposase